MSYCIGKEAKLAIVKMCLTFSFVDEILDLVIEAIKLVVIFFLVCFGQNQCHLENDQDQNNPINERHVD